MNTFDPQPRKAEEKAAKEARMQYVEELASAEAYPDGDAWISLTDAARVTRTSEAMARRWVTSGRLPVKKEAVGIPPRTRLVRLSDVAAIRPIVDPTAAITGEVRKLDLPSIPRQQMQIMEDHQRLLAQTTALHEIVEREMTELRAHLRRDLDALETHLQTRHDTLATHVTQQLAAFRDSMTEQLAGTRESIQEQRTELERLAAALADQHQHLTEAHTELVQRVNTLDQTQQHRFTEVTARLDAQGQAQHRQSEALNNTLTQTTEALEQQRRDLSAQREALERDQARDVATLTQQLEAIDSKLAQIVTNANNALAPVQKRIEAQEQQIRRLSQELQQEHEVHETFSTTLDAQREQIEALRELVETLTKRKKA